MVLLSVPFVLVIHRINGVVERVAGRRVAEVVGEGVQVQFLPLNARFRRIHYNCLVSCTFCLVSCRQAFYSRVL